MTISWSAGGAVIIRTDLNLPYKKAYVNVEYYASRTFNFRKEVLQRSFAPCFVKTVLGRKD